MSKRERLTDPNEMIQYLRDYAAVKLEPTIADAAEMLENHEYRMLGVMLSVDKWLDGEELEQDEANRAATMREKTLRIAETLQAESDEKDKRIAELEAQLDEFSAFLCDMTGGRMSKTNYSAQAMIMQANDYQQEQCDKCDMVFHVRKEDFDRIVRRNRKLEAESAMFMDIIAERDRRIEELQDMLDEVFHDQN